MATPVTSSIGDGGGRDYSTPAAWLADMPSDLTTDDSIQIGELYNDSEYLNEGFTLTGITTDATRYIHLTVATGESAFDDSSNAIAYNQSNGVGVRQTTIYGNAVDLNVDYTRVSRIQFQGGTGAATNSFKTGSDTGVLVDDCLFDQLHAINDAISHVYTNCVFARTDTGKNAMQNNEWRFCSFVRAPGTGGDAIAGNNYAFGNVVQNCAFFGYDDFTSDTSRFTSGSCWNCAADFASGLIGSNNVHSVTFSATTPFVDAPNGSLDLKLADDGNDLINAGLDDTEVTVDIFGTARSDPPEIGAFELAAAGGNTVRYSLPVMGVG